MITVTDSSGNPTAINIYNEYGIPGANQRGPYASDAGRAEAIGAEGRTQRSASPVYPAVYTKSAYCDDSVRIHMNDPI